MRAVCRKQRTTVGEKRRMSHGNAERTPEVTKKRQKKEKRSKVRQKPTNNNGIRKGASWISKIKTKQRDNQFHIAVFGTVHTKFHVMPPLLISLSFFHIPLLYFFFFWFSFNQKLKYRFQLLSYWILCISAAGTSSNGEYSYSYITVLSALATQVDNSILNVLWMICFQVAMELLISFYNSCDR